MSAEPTGFLEVDYYPLNYAGETPKRALAAKTQAIFFRLATVLECLWSFYEAMRQGIPLPHADEKLALLGGAMRTGNKGR